MKKINTYRYFAIFEYYTDENGADAGISVTFPDLDGCVSHGKDEEEALKNAREVLALHMYGIEEDGEEVPKPSSLRSLNLSANECAVLIEAYMPAFREKIRNSYVKKTLSIPYWMNAEAEAKGINFSSVLQEALRQRL